MIALGVFDGHSGSEAAHFAKEKLLGHIKVRRSEAFIALGVSGGGYAL